MLEIDIFIPLKNCKSIDQLITSIREQENVTISNIFVSVQKNDLITKKTIKGLKNISVITIDKFSHSKTREEAILNLCTKSIVVLLTQDVILKNKNTLSLLVESIQGNCVFAYSRQISNAKNIDRYMREFNYPDYDIVKTQSDISKLGLKTFFASDACSALNRDFFLEIKGYDGKNLQTNEDMYYAHKVIMSGKSVKYVSSSEVIHSHNRNLKDIKKWYYQVGCFVKQNIHISNCSKNNSGKDAAKYVLKRIIEEKDVKSFLMFVPDMMTRYFSYKKGYRHG